MCENPVCQTLGFHAIKFFLLALPQQSTWLKWIAQSAIFVKPNIFQVQERKCFNSFVMDGTPMKQQSELELDWCIGTPIYIGRYDDVADVSHQQYLLIKVLLCMERSETQVASLSLTLID